MTSRGRNEIAAADNQRFEGYIDGCGMCGSIGHSINDCPILQEPQPPFRPQPVQESSLEDLMKQLAMNNIQFKKNVSATQQPVQQPNNSPSLEDLVQQFQQNTMQIQQNNMQFQQNIIATVQELTTQIGQLATTINQLQFEDFGQNSTTVLGFADSSSVANSMLAATNSTKMTEIDNCMPTVSDLVDVVKIANSMTDVTDLTDMTLDEISDQVTRVEIVDPACADVDTINPMCANAKMDDPRYANADNAFAEGAEDVDSMVDKSDNVNMTESADSMVEGLDLPDKIAISDLADSRKRDEVTIDSNIQEEAIAKSNNLEGAGSKSNNQEATEPNFRSRNHKQAENEPVPNCRDSTRVESDSNNKTDTESDSDKQSQKQLKAETDSATQVPNPDRVGQLKLRRDETNSCEETHATSDSISDNRIHKQVPSVSDPNVEAESILGNQGRNRYQEKSECVLSS
ncbi:hypothetical protein CR513_29193, partial [Mucuna pruriens]